MQRSQRLQGQETTVASLPSNMAQALAQAARATQLGVEFSDRTLRLGFFLSVNLPT